MARLCRIADSSRAVTFYRASSRPVGSLAKIDFSRFSTACISLARLDRSTFDVFIVLFVDVLYALIFFEMTVLIDDYSRRPVIFFCTKIEICF